MTRFYSRYPAGVHRRSWKVGSRSTSLPQNTTIIIDRADDLDSRNCMSRGWACRDVRIIRLMSYLLTPR